MTHACPTLDLNLLPPRTPRSLFAMAAGAALLGLLVSTSAEASAPEPLEWKTALKHFQIDSDKFVGQRFSFSCPTRPAGLEMPEIHGTNVYPSTTPLCPAALHAGMLSSKGGRITVQLNPGLDGYAGSKKRGLSSRPFPGTPRSLVFVGENFADRLTPVQREHAPRLKWTTKFTATGLAQRKLVGQRFVFHCPQAPAKLPGRRVYGTDRYAFNSLVCLTAIHAGRLTRAGGFVALRLVEAEGRLEGSLRHGVESKSGPGGDRQLIFLTLPSELAATAEP